MGSTSSGLHSNGYSLVRKICFEKLKLKASDTVDVLDRTIGEELLEPRCADLLEDLVAGEVLQHGEAALSSLGQVLAPEIGVGLGVERMLTQRGIRVTLEDFLVGRGRLEHLAHALTQRLVVLDYQDVGVAGRGRFGDSNIDDATIGLQLEIPLYTGGGVSAATRQARFRYEAAQQVLEQRRRAVQTQVRNAYRGVLANISRVKALEAAEVSAQSALEATEAGFEVGTRTLVDVLDNQRDLFRARRDLAVSRYDYILNFLSLLQAAGTLDDENVAKANEWLADSSAGR